MNEQSIKVRIRWIIPPALFGKARQLETSYLCFEMDKIVVCEHFEDNGNYDIVIDALSGVKRITVSEQFLQSLTEERHLRYLIRCIKSQLFRLGLLEQFIPDIRKLYTYGMQNFPDREMNYKFKYATVGDYKFIDGLSLKYLKEYATKYENNYCFDGGVALANYLLALNENDEDVRIRLFRTAISLFELERLDDFLPFDSYAIEHALCLIEWGDILSSQRKIINDYKDGQHLDGPCRKPYEKAIEIMKLEIEYEVSQMKSRPMEQHQEYGDFIRSLVEKIDARLRKSHFTSYRGILPVYCEERLKPLL